MVGEKSFRASFEDMVVAQERLRKKLDELIEENRPLRDKFERADFFNLLARSTLGLGVEREYVVRCKNKNRVERFNMGSTEGAARWLAYLNKNEHTFNCTIPCGPNFCATVSISDLWQILLDCLFEVWPFALTQAARFSAERVPYIKTGGDVV